MFLQAFTEFRMCRGRRIPLRDQSPLLGTARIAVFSSFRGIDRI